MLIELLATSNYISFNSKLAHVIGLHSAIYLAEIININEKAIRKDKLDKNAFILDRNYIELRTTINEKEQRELDKGLINLGILKEVEKDHLEIDMTILTSIMMTEDEGLLKDISKVTQNKKTQKQAKAEALLTDTKTVVITDDVAIREAYYEWIDTIFAKDGYLAKKAVSLAQQVLLQFAPNDLQTQLKIINIATINTYRDMSWAINTFKRENPYYKPVTTIINNTIVSEVKNNSNIFKPKRLSDEVF